MNGIAKSLAPATALFGILLTACSVIMPCRQRGAYLIAKPSSSDFSASIALSKFYDVDQIASTMSSRNYLVNIIRRPMDAGDDAGIPRGVKLHSAVVISTAKLEDGNRSTLAVRCSDAACYVSLDDDHRCSVSTTEIKRLNFKLLKDLPMIKQIGPPSGSTS